MLINRKQACIANGLQSYRTVKENTIALVNSFIVRFTRLKSERFSILCEYNI